VGQGLAPEQQNSGVHSQIEIRKQRLVNVRFTPDSEHSSVQLECPLSAISRHEYFPRWLTLGQRAVVCCERSKSIFKSPWAPLN
jgi:hypothetical protein